MYGFVSFSVEACGSHNVKTKTTKHNCSHQKPAYQMFFLGSILRGSSKTRLFHFGPDQGWIPIVLDCSVLFVGLPLDLIIPVVCYEVHMK
jgi:hypothetical protein